ncbi:ABC transporter ATP-binding protein [Iamia majanohamensis]|uniref:ABC transporter ATP-binding protein n=1 Tax=Iamia majanohamensis TaxID=467976 RepID=A0AAE9YBJ3_9ACTN|nr:ABC transporter ATP-binding protein [Iamia majanohamensis]WCO68073.1 ABC transporter ATP-binding protein [Iamia majanohamensis]
MPPTAEDRAPAALELTEVSVHFGGIAALDEVSLSLAPGQVRGLIGANGAGKTTLFDVISGIRTPDRGRVELLGRDVTAWSPHRRARAGLRRTFQRVQVFGWLTIEENLLVATEWRGGGGGVLGDLVGAPTRRSREAARRARARQVLATCGLEDMADRQATGLPTGTARLVELGRALVDDPAVLLLDEPASGLDHAEADRFADVVDAISRESGTSVLLVEHDVAFVLRHCHRITVLDLGRTLADGTPEEIRSHDAVRAAYLGAALP